MCRSTAPGPFSKFLSRKQENKTDAYPPFIRISSGGARESDAAGRSAKARWAGTAVPSTRFRVHQYGGKMMPPIWNVGAENSLRSHLFSLLECSDGKTKAQRGGGT